MTDRDAFLRAIHAAPDDDAPRLIYCDWLEENGEPDRAEFIRVQIAMMQEYRVNKHSTRYEELFVRQRRLFKARWAGAMKRFRASSFREYSRGFFFEWFHLDAERFVEDVSGLIGWLGPRGGVVIKNCIGFLDRVAACTDLAWFKRVKLSGGVEGHRLTDNDVRDFFRSPHLEQLEVLSIDSGRPYESSPLTSEVAVEIGRATRLQRLISLSLEGVGLDVHGAELLIASEHLHRLEHLECDASTLPQRVRRDLLSRFHSALPERISTYWDRPRPR